MRACRVVYADYEKVVHLPKGLYCLRVEGGGSCTCSVEPAAGNDDVVEVLRSPFKAREKMLRSGDGIAIRCLAAAAVELAYEAEPGADPLDFVLIV